MLIKKGGVYKNVSPIVFEIDFKAKGYEIVDEQKQGEPQEAEKAPEGTSTEPKRTVKKK